MSEDRPVGQRPLICEPDQPGHPFYGLVVTPPPYSPATYLEDLQAWMKAEDWLKDHVHGGVCWWAKNAGRWWEEGRSLALRESLEFPPLFPVDGFTTQIAYDSYMCGLLTWARTAEIVADEELPTVWYHGERGYSADRREPIVVTPTEHNVLQIFLKKTTALATKDLEETGGNVAQTVAALRDKYSERFAPAIRTPGDEKGTGYYIRVRPIPTI